jgi:hypothetical protein
MTITFIGAGADTINSATIPYPGGGLVGDLLVVFWHTDTNTDNPAIAGFTLQGSTGSTQASSKNGTLYGFATGTGGGNLTITGAWTVGTFTEAICLRYAGVSPITPFNAYNINSNLSGSLNATASSLTPTVAGMEIGCVDFDFGITSTTPPTGFTYRAGGISNNFQVADRMLSASGATGTSVWGPANGTGSAAVIHGVLNPAPYFAAVTTGSVSGVGTAAPVSPLTVAHTVPTGLVDSCLVIDVVAGVCSSTPGGQAAIALSATWNGVAITSRGRFVNSTNTTDGFIERYVVPTGTGDGTSHNFVVSWTGWGTAPAGGPPIITAAVQSFGGVDQTTPVIGTDYVGSGTTGPAAASVTSVGATDLIVATCGTGTDVTAYGLTQRWDVTGNDRSAAGSTGGETGYGSGTVSASFTITNDFWQVLANRLQAKQTVTVDPPIPSYDRLKLPKDLLYKLLLQKQQSYPQVDATPPDVVINAQIAQLALTGVAGTVMTDQTVAAQVANLALTGIPGVMTPGGVTVSAQQGQLTLTAVPGTPTPGPATVTAQVGQLTLSGVAGALQPGGVSVTAQQALLTLSGVPASVGSLTSIPAQVASLTLTGIPGTLIPGARSFAAQVANLVLTAVPGVMTPGGVSVAAQIANLVLSAIPSVMTPGGVTKTAQVGLLSLTGVPGVMTPGGVTKTAQIATLTLSGIPGTLQPGGVSIPAQQGLLTLTAIPGQVKTPQTIAAQVSTLTLSGVPGTLVIGTFFNAQVANLALSGIAGTMIAGGVTKAAQTAILTLSGVPGIMTPGGVTKAAQTALLSLTAVPGTLIPGGATIPAQVALLSLTARAGTLIPGTATIAAQTALLNLLAQAGTMIPGGITILAQPGFLALIGVGGTIVMGNFNPSAPLTTMRWDPQRLSARFDSARTTDRYDSQNYTGRYP